MREVLRDCLLAVGGAAVLSEGRVTGWPEVLVLISHSYLVLPLVVRGTLFLYVVPSLMTISRSVEKVVNNHLVLGETSGRGGGEGCRG